jgi:cytoskeletal protein CcmA (bactofilin family)
VRAMRAYLCAVAGWLAITLLTACDGGVIEITLVTGGTLTVPEGLTRDGVVAVLDGELLVERGALLRGTVLVLGGRAALDGRLEGDVIALGGALRLGPSAHVTGDVMAAGEAELGPQARIEGALVLGPAVPATLSELVRSGPSTLRSVVQRALTLALLGTLAARFAPRAVGHLSEAVRRHWLTAGALGALAFLVGLVLLVVMAFTVVLIPVSLVGLAVGLVALMVGWSSVGIALGTSLAARLGGGRSGPWRERLAVALGIFAVVAALGLLERLPVLGALIALTVTAVGFGAVLLTGFGTRRFVPDVPGPVEPGAASMPAATRDER